MSGDPNAGGVEEQSGRTAGDDDCCSAGRHGLTDHDVELDVRTFSALANDTRYEVLRLLATAEDEVCVCEIVPEFDVTQSTLSRALGALYQAGLVDRRKDGRWRYYATTTRAEKLLTAIDTTREETV